MTEPAAPDDVDAPELIVFDIGEVLIDETRIWTIWADMIGVSPLTFAAVLGASITQGGDHREVFGELAPNIEWAGLADAHQQRLGGLTDADLYADVRAVLAELAGAGFGVALAGNQPQRRRDELLDLGLATSMVITSDELGAEKPDAAFFEGMARRLGVDDPDRVLYVGDRVDNDILPAHAFGLRTCWIRRGPWGRLQDLPEGIEPDLVLEGLGELPELLTTWRDG